MCSTPKTHRRARSLSFRKRAKLFDGFGPDCKAAVTSRVRYDDAACHRRAQAESVSCTIDQLGPDVKCPCPTTRRDVHRRTERLRAEWYRSSVNSFRTLNDQNATGRILLRSNEHFSLYVSTSDLPLNQVIPAPKCHYVDFEGNPVDYAGKAAVTVSANAQSTVRPRRRALTTAHRRSAGRDSASG